ncbi:MAG: histidine phosphatase family protein [Betaproteobacteria bacterium]
MRIFLRCLLLALAWLHFVAQAGELADKLKGGQHVLLMRHAYAPGVGDPPGYTLERCETQRVLNEEGRSQSQRIGRWLRAQGLEGARVYASPWCRCTQTAELLGLGSVTVEPSLASFFDQPDQAAGSNKRLQAFIAKSLAGKQAQPLVLVTHHVNIREFMGKDIGSGDMVLARVDGQGRMVNYRIYPSP